MQSSINLHDIILTSNLNNKHTSAIQCTPTMTALLKIQFQNTYLSIFLSFIMSFLKLYFYEYAYKLLPYRLFSY